jgi:hypothetical protein
MPGDRLGVRYEQPGNGDGMHPGGEVHLVRWPAEAGDRRRFGEMGELCLLLVEPNELPPDDVRRSEDWVRSTADPIEVHWRIERLRALNPRPVGPPEVDDDNIVSFGDQWLPLGPLDARLVSLLSAHFGTLVHRDDLRAAIGDSLSDAALSVRLFRLRRQLAPLGLNITTVRARGYVLEPSGTREASRVESR